MMEKAKRFAPMLCSLGAEIKDDPDWLFELKMDGIRAVACRENGTWKLWNRYGSEISLQFPDIMEGLESFVGADCVLDGEIVCLKNGLVSFHDMQFRIHKQDRIGIEYALKLHPASFYPFDIPSIAGNEILDEKLLYRRDILARIAKNNSNVTTLPFIVGEGKWLFEQVLESGREGIVAKHMASTYRPGIRSPSWVKYKNFTEEVFEVGGFTEGKGEREIGALILKENGIEIGKCSGFDQREIEEIKQLKAENKNVQVVIRYLERTNHNRLRMPVFRRIKRKEAK